MSTQPHHSQEPDPRRADSGERTLETRLGAGQEPSSPFELPSEQEPCTHDELDHSICLYCGEDRDMNSPFFGKKV